MNYQMAGGLMIQLAADVGKLRVDMDAAKGIVDKYGADVDKMVGFAKGALGALAGIGSIAAFTGMIKSAVDAQGALHDLSITTGMSVAALGQFKGVGSYTETSLEQITGASLKLSKGLAAASDDSKGAGAALKALGLNLADIKKMAPEEQMLAVAKALDQFKDGSEKSAVAMALMGKSGAAMLPFLKDLAEAQEKGKINLDENEKALRANQAAMADAFGDNLTAIRKNSEGWKKDLANGLLPVLFEASEVFKQMMGGTGGLKEAISKLAKDGTLAEWGRNLLTILSYIVDAFQIAWRVVESVVKAMTGYVAAIVEQWTSMGDAMKLFLKGDFSGATKAMQDGFNKTKTIAVEAGKSIADTWDTPTMGSKFRDRMADIKGMSAIAADSKKDLNYSGVLEENSEANKKARAEEEKHQKQVSSLIAEVNKLTDGFEQQMGTGQSLTTVQKKQLDIEKQLEAGTLKLSDAERKKIDSALENARTTEIAALAQQNYKKMVEEGTKTEASAIEAINKHTASLQEQIDKQLADTAVLLGNKDATEELVTSKLRAQAALSESTAAFLREHYEVSAEADALEAQAAKLRELAQAKEDFMQIKPWADLANTIQTSLTDSLFRAFESGKGFFDTLWKGIVNTFKTTILKLAISGPDGKGGIVGSVLNAVGLGGSGGGSALSSLGSISSLGDIGSLLSNGWSSLTNLPSSLGLNFINSGIGQSLGLSSLQDIGGNMIAGPTGLGSSLMDGISMGGDILGYGSALLSAAQGKWGSAAGSAIGTYFGGPIGSAIGSAIGGLADKLFGSAGTPQMGGSYVSNGSTGFKVTNGGSGLDRAWGASVGEHYSQDVQNVLETVTGGAASLLNNLSKAFGGAGGYQVGAFFASDNNRASQANRSILKDGQIVSDWSGSGLDKDATKGLQQLTDALAGQVRDAMQQIDVPKWAKDTIDKLDVSPTMQQLAAAVESITAVRTALDGMGKALSPLGGVFSTIGSLSEEAKLSLLNMAGGMDALIAKSKQFVTDYYSDAEKFGISAKQIQDALSALGVNGSGLTDKASFRALVESQDLSTEAGLKLFNQLLDIAPAFAQIADYMSTNNLSLTQLAASAPQAALIDSLTKGQDAQAAAQATAVEQAAAQIEATQQGTENIVSAVTVVSDKIEALTTAMTNWASTMKTSNDDRLYANGAQP